MKTVLRHIGIITVGCLLILGGTLLADEKPGRIYLIRTHYGVMPEDGSTAERDSLILELVKLHRSNKKVVRVITLVPYDTTDDTQEWIVIYEYKKIEDIDEATRIDLELNMKKWPDDVDRENFFRRLAEYFPSHTDKVYREIPKFRQ